MNIKNRIERLESLLTTRRDDVIWNFENLSTADLNELCDLIDRDPHKALALQNRLIAEGKLAYEHQK